MKVRMIDVHDTYCRSREWVGDIYRARCTYLLLKTCVYYKVHVCKGEGGSSHQRQMAKSEATLADREGGYGDCNPPFKFQK